MKNPSSVYIKPVAAISIAVAILIGLHQLDVSPENLRTLGREYPGLFIAAFLILPTLGVPINFFLLAAGVLFPLPVSTLLLILGMGFHMALSYHLANGILRPYLSGWLAQHPKIERMLTIPNQHHQWVTFVFFFIPGLPYAAKNYLFPLSSVPFKIYFLIGWPTHALLGIVFILLGNELVEGDWKMISVLLVLILGIGSAGYLLKKRTVPATPS